MFLVNLIGRWPDDGQVRPKHVAIKIKETNNLITKYAIVVFDGICKQFVYLVK
jgi:hypothetical protein